MQTEGVKNQNRNIVIGVIVFILASVIVYFVIENMRISAEKEQREIELNNTVLQLDSISGELDNRIRTIEELGGEIDTLLSIRAQLETEKKELLDLDKRRQKNISQLRDRVGGYQELLLLKDEEIKQLKVLNEQLLTENTDLKNEKNELNQNLQAVNQQKEQLAQQVALAGKLRMEGLKVTAVNNRGKEREAEFRNRHIDQLKITFSVAENNVAPIEGKELMVRIVAPDGNVLFDVSRGSGSFFFEGRELFYTAKKEILYDRTRQEITILYDKGSEYAIGQHQVEVYTDDYQMGKGFFTVK